jgi:hypothetical protein
LLDLAGPDPAREVLADLDRLEASVAALPSGGSRAPLATRLRVLLAALEDSPAPSDDVSSASAEDLLALIESEFRTS